MKRGKAKAMAVVAATPDEYPYLKKRDKEGYHKTPWCAYFYYIHLQGAVYRTTQYYYNSQFSEIRRGELDELIEELTLNARLPPNVQDPKPIGSEWQNIVWQRKSYLIVVVDDPNYEFDEKNAIEFYQSQPDGTYNHSFFDAKDFKLDLPPPQGGPGTQRITAVACLNHMKKDTHGNDIEVGERQKFYFTFNPRLRRLVPDDGGNNLGPPVPPPA